MSSSEPETERDISALSGPKLGVCHTPRPEPKRPKHSVHWFRKGLRLHDNPSLRDGVRGATTLRCIFVLDPWFAGSSNVGINKWR